MRIRTGLKTHIVTFGLLCSFMFMNLRVLQADGLIESRVTEHWFQTSIEDLSPNAKSVWETLSEKAEELGRMPSLPEFAELVIDAEKPLTSDEQDRLLSLFWRIQNQPIERRDLFELRRAQRALMTSYRAQYVVNYRANLLRPEPLEEPIRLECDFAFDGPKAFYEKAVFQNDELALRETEGFDGEALRGLLREPGHSPHGYIMTLDSRSRKRFYGFGNPFLAAGLLNGPIDWGRDVQGMDDLAEQMRTSLIFETPVEIDGIECLAFGCFQEMYFCAPELGYAFIELRSGKYRLDKATGAYEKSDSCLVQKNSDFVEVIDGLQLPQTIEHIHMRDGEVFVDFTTTVQKYEVNEEIPDELFTDIIPNGVHVIDGILGFGYVQDSSKKNEGIGEQ